MSQKYLLTVSTVLVVVSLTCAEKNGTVDGMKAGVTDGFTFIVELNDECNKKCNEMIRKAAHEAGCLGCKLDTLGHSAVSRYDATGKAMMEDFLKLTCTKGGTAKAEMLKKKMMGLGMPVECVEEDGVGYAQGFDAIELEPVARSTSGLLWNVDELDGKAKNGQRCQFSLLGDSVIVVVMDTGCTPKGPRGEFEEIRCKNFVNDKVDPPCRDGHGHGTHVAGVVAGEKYGVSPFASVACLRVLGDRGQGSFSNFIHAINLVSKFALKTWHPIVINLSLAGRKSAALNDAAKAAARAGVYISVAAGNFNKDAREFSPGSAADNQRIYAIGAHNSSGKRGGFSNYGPLVKLSGPGVNIESNFKGGTTRRLSGTSMAAPHVAGAMANLLSDGHDPTLELLQAKAVVDYKGTKVHKAKYECDIFL